MNEKEVHDFVWDVVQKRWKSGQPIVKAEVRIQCMKNCTKCDFFVNILEKAGNTNHIYVFLKRINLTDIKATICQQTSIYWKDRGQEGAARVVKRGFSKHVPYNKS